MNRKTEYKGLPLEAREALRSTRLKYGLSQQKLAERVGLYQAIIAAWEGGIQRPSFRHLNHSQKIYDALEKDPAVEFVRGYIALGPSLEMSDTSIAENLVKLLRAYKEGKNPLKEAYERLEAVFTRSSERDAAQLYGELEALVIKYESKLEK